MNKTQRKNKTKQVINWPSNDVYFTIKDLVVLNPHMLTLADKPSDITLRVRLKKAIDETKQVAEIGTKNAGKGRPEKIFGMRPVQQSVLDLAKADKMQIFAETQLISVMEITNKTPTQATPIPTPETTPVSLTANTTDALTV